MCFWQVAPHKNKLGCFGKNFWVGSKRYPTRKLFMAKLSKMHKLIFVAKQKKNGVA